MQKIVPFLWFDGKAEEAAKFYTSIFKNAKVEHVSPMVSTFNLEGQEFMALNGGPNYKFTPAISFFVKCEGQEEVDHFWEQLSAGGRTDRCGWLQDKYGLSWQVVPTIFIKMMSDKDPAKSQRVMAALMQMTKIEISKLQEAYNSAITGP
jgi:predicted 3-demethylubiquinone-9 3-methyltransferase (glyoxalase superfamily)